MAHSEPFPADVLGAVASDVGRRLPANAEWQAAEMRETFPIWMLSLDALRASEQPLRDLATRTGRWHHQINVAGRPRAFARSVPLGPSSDHWSVTQVADNSELAESIDRAIDWVDKHVQGDPVVHLLVVPAYYLHAFWMHEGDADSILVIDRPSDRQDLELEKLYTPDQFIQVLTQKPPPNERFPDK
jgi:hypothetical protein